MTRMGDASDDVTPTQHAPTELAPSAQPAEAWSLDDYKEPPRWWTAGRITSVRHIRLHGARHSCGTLMHLENVPIAVISVLLGHASKAFTMATYVHSQPDVLAAAAQSFARVVDRRS